MLGAGVISPFSSFSSLRGAGLFWELQGLRAGGGTGLTSPSQEVAQREGVLLWDKRGGQVVKHK